jgi:hypothetical protein
MNKDFGANGADSSYNLTKKEKATPYYTHYWAAWLQRPVYEDPKVPVLAYKNPRRTFPVVLILVLMIALIAVLAISYLGVLPRLSLFNKVNDADVPEDDQFVGADDIVNSTLKSFSIMEPEGDLVFYNSALKDIDTVGAVQMLAYYAIPVSIVLSLVTAIYIIIKVLISLTDSKRALKSAPEYNPYAPNEPVFKWRKFAYINLLLLLFTLLGIVGGLVWNGEPLSASALPFLTGSGDNLNLGYGYYALVGIDLLAWIMGIISYRSMKAVKAEAKVTGYRRIED